MLFGIVLLFSMFLEILIFELFSMLLGIVLIFASSEGRHKFIS
jgi:hypothetical protein